MNKSNIKYVGVFDDKIDLFEGQYPVPDGVSYNSYLITDEKTVIFDTVDASFGEEWLKNVDAALSGRAPDYLAVLHMEPDHSANIKTFLDKYPEARVVSSAKAFTMMKNFFGTDFAERRIVVGDGDTLNIGEGTLTFLTAPMVHWPEVTVAYYDKEKTLFSADGFGKFGNPKTDDGWADEARRYYIGIVGKYGTQVQALLKKAAKLDIEKICPLHGPVLTEDLARYIELYDKWSRYEAEERGVVIAYTSVYGNTRRAAEILREKLCDEGIKTEIYDLARCDTSAAVAAAFRYSSLVLATTTYNATVFPHMREFISHLTERGFKNRRVGFIENGSWAPMAEKVMRSMLEGAQGIEYAETSVKILSAVSGENLVSIEALAKELAK